MPDTNERDIAVLGAGMHQWGKWGRNFVEYGLVAARAALADAGVDQRDVGYIAGADTIRNGYPGFVSGATFAQALGWSGARISSSYAACASGAQAIANARAQILAGLTDVALVVGADAAPKGFFQPVGGERRDDPDWLRFHLLGATNPIYFALYARRRMALHGATLDDFAAVKVKNARHGLNNPYARYRKEVSAEEVAASAVVSDPLRLLDICATSDGGAALVLTSMEYARLRRQHRTGPDPGAVHGDADVPEDGARPAGFRDRLRRGRVAAVAHVPFRHRARRLRGGRDRSRRPVLRGGLRSVHRARAGLVRGHRPL